MIARPRLLLADEPTGNVDDAMAYRLVHLFEELNKLGTTIVIATHNHHLVERLGHGSLSLADGQLTITEAKRVSVLEEKTHAEFLEEGVRKKEGATKSQKVDSTNRQDDSTPKIDPDSHLVENL